MNEDLFPQHPLVGTRMGLDEFLALPEEKPYLELWDGVVVQKAWPGVHHSVLQTELLFEINRFAEPRRLALVFPELTCIIAGSALIPDVTVLRWDCVPRDDDGRIAEAYGNVPDIAIEVTSPEQGANYPLRRCLWYVEHGVGIALQVDPCDRSVVRFTADARPTVARGADRIDLDSVLPGFEMTVEGLFDALKMR